MKLEDIIIRLRVEENNHKSKKSDGSFHLMESKTNIVEWGSNTNKKRKRNGEGQIDSSKTPEKFKSNCYNCDRIWIQRLLKAKECQRKNSSGQCNKTWNIFDKVQDMNRSDLFEFNLVGHMKKWWVDTRATHHICTNSWMLSTYKAIDHDEQLYMKNSSSFKVERHGKIVLTNVLHVPDIRNNLVNGSY